MPNPRAVTDGAMRNLPVDKSTNRASPCRPGTSKAKRVIATRRIHMEVANTSLTRDMTKGRVVAGSGELVEGTIYGKLEARMKAENGNAMNCQVAKFAHSLNKE